MGRKINTGLLSAREVIGVAKYLGHATHDEDGFPTPIALAVGDALGGKVKENAALTTTIAEEWAKAKAAREKEAPECETCGAPLPEDGKCGSCEYDPEEDS